MINSYLCLFIIRTNFNQNACFVVIRSNPGTTVNVVDGDVVNHYGYADVVDITKVSSSSYHEYGTVGSLTIDEGKVEVESTGYIAQATINNNAQFVAENDTKVGYLVASETATVTGAIIGVREKEVDYVATADDNKKTYTEDETTKTALFVSSVVELKNAFNGTTSLEGVTKVCLANDIAVGDFTDYYVFKVKDTITLDLNGHVLSGTSIGSTGNQFFIDVPIGTTLNLYDTVGNGMIDYTVGGTGSAGWNGKWAIHVDRGTMNMYSGIVKCEYGNTLDNFLAFAVDLYANGTGTATFNMYGGTILSFDEALCLRPNDDSAIVNANIYNGYIYGYDAIFIQQPSANVVRTVNLNIDGGSFVGECAPIRVYEAGVAGIKDKKFVTITLNGGNYNGLGSASLQYGAIYVRNAEVDVTGWEVVTVNDNR